jgi:hypothetical protein
LPLSTRRRDGDGKGNSKPKRRRRRSVRSVNDGDSLKRSDAELQAGRAIFADPFP